MPGYADAREARPKMQSGLDLARLNGSWISGTEYAYREGQTWSILDAKTLEVRTSEEDPRPAAAERPRHPNSQRRRPGRGRQYDRTYTADGKLEARYVEGNIVLIQDGKQRQLTTEGSLAAKIKYGSGSWVYGEELGQDEAMGFSPDGKYLWAYRFDESKVLDYHIVLDQNRSQSRLFTEAYPKPGQPNPEVDLYIFNVQNGERIKVQVREGDFDLGLGHYVYDIRWAPDGSSLLFRRTDRRQKTMEFCSASPVSGRIRVLWSESNPDAWVENAFPVTYFDELDDIADAPELKDHVLWMSEKTGWTNFYLLNLKTGESRAITNHQFEVRSPVRIDLKRKTLWYMAFNGDRPAMSQLNKIGFNGAGHARLTDPSLSHDVDLSDDGYMVDTAQSVEQAPIIRLIDPSGSVKKVLAESNVSAIAENGYAQPEHFTYLAADGETVLNGVLHKPYNFDPNKKYPALVSVYGGPLGPMAGSFSERYRTPQSLCDYGFIILEVENRGQGGRGRKFKNALYQQMGHTEIDDVANGVKSLWEHSWFDKERVGVYGTSYGGYFSFMSLFRHPDVFAAACASAGPSDWRNYDTIYTERYMGILPESEEAYDRCSTLTYAKDLKGWLMIYTGTADDNVHPSNSFQVMQALSRAGKFFEVQMGVDAGHSGLNQRRMAEFFIERLILDGPRG